MYEWLKEYIKLREEISYLELKLDQNQTELKRWVEGDLSKVKLEADSIASGLEDKIEMQLKLLDEKKKQRDELIALVEKFEGLDNQILRMKWFEGKTLEQIAEELQYSYGYIKRKHADIMKMIKFADSLASNL
ncbi:sigma factor-like helix-turn-helix DNA-binding protein [Ureibacillus sinduriensis]|uniref:RNA polymerase sigma-70 region 4 domain-containing protein n=1 Tax=Ureibacillus sinduriensis BLB-1 = JCM 15800 TaxID=1384057 RepID=A0A0A3HQM8_9BACL|nr:sigma factor-like helix-turn-helix DNA-binding protein [Ureibacillus sinduriensis]KGR74881.1 hypothetical protein CD33_14070 [Ureibacillus sinduriensis BLB-1 = JCM 15800]